MLSSRNSMNLSKPRGTSFTGASQTTLEKPWPKLTDIPKPSDISLKSSDISLKSSDISLKSSDISLKSSDISLKSSDIHVERSKIFLGFANVRKVPFCSQQEVDFKIFAGMLDKNRSVESPDLRFDLNAEVLFVDAADKFDQSLSTLPWSVVIESKRKQNSIEFQSTYIDILDQVKREAEQAYLLDSDIEKIKDETYDDSAIVMEEIFKAGVSSPEVDWNEDGSINLSWFLKTGGTSTILLYGDDYAIYNAYLERDNYVRSVCKIRGNSVFPKLIEILSDITE
jgi:hypothetical protein